MEKKYGKELAVLAYKARLLAVDAVHRASSGHPGGSLSCADALTALYFNEMKVDPANPKWEDRDRFVLSKGHCAPSLYAVLALRGFFPVEDLQQLRSIKSHLSGHPDMRYVPGVDMSTGSLGQGLSTAVGMALSAKITGKQFRTYAICGDGEVAEGQIWEALMSAAKWKLDNLCAFIDVNGLQIDGATKDVMPTEPLDKKLESFNWHVVKIDGHNMDQILAALAEARATKDKPT
ncbi:MAG: transketolase, partial [Oscillospiraceae bacterium]|nr:transketolase [Oscillospiraceae bacterium]